MHKYICTKYKIILVFGNSKHEQQNKKVVAYFSIIYFTQDTKILNNATKFKCK